MPIRATNGSPPLHTRYVACSGAVWRACEPALPRGVRSNCSAKLEDVARWSKAREKSVVDHGRGLLHPTHHPKPPGHGVGP